jgi:hypothetical protein
MKFYFYKKSESSSKPKGKIAIGCRRTMFGIGFKTLFVSDPKIAGDSSRIIKLLSEAAEEIDSNKPFAITRYVQERLDDYEIQVTGTVGIYEQEGVIVLRGGKYITIDELQDFASRCSQEEYERMKKEILKRL